MWIHQSPFCLIFFFKQAELQAGTPLTRRWKISFFPRLRAGRSDDAFRTHDRKRDSNAARRSLRGHVATRHRRVLGSYRVSRGGAALLHFMRTRVELMAAALTSPPFIFKVLLIEDKGRKSCIIL